MYTIQHLSLDFKKVRKAEFILTALQNPRRQKILDLLDINGAMNPQHLAFELKLNVDTINEHLATLRRTGVVKIKRDDRQIFYYLDDDRLEGIISAIHNFHKKSEHVLIENLL